MASQRTLNHAQRLRWLTEVVQRNRLGVDDLQIVRFESHGLGE